VECLKKLKDMFLGVHLKDIDSIGNTKANDLIVGTGKNQLPCYLQRAESPEILRHVLHRKRE